MNSISNQKGLRHKITALFLSICLSAAFAPSVFAAESPSDITAASVQTEQTTQAAQTTQATQPTQAAQTEQTPSTYTKTSNAGFENVESDGGTMFVGTARIPKADGSFATVKFIYSSGINLNEKSLNLINTELNACGVTVSGSMVYVSHSDIVSDSTLVSETSERQAVFACGSEAAPTVLTAYPAYDSVETSFEYLYRGYVYSIAEYTSLSSVLAGRSEITLSDDGKSAYTSIVMAEDYVEKVINGKTVKILMINSELKYCFRAPRLVYVKDDNYNVASASDIVYHYGTTTSTATTETTLATTDESSAQSAETTAATSSQELIISSDTESESAASQTTPATTTTASTEAQSTTDTTTINIWDYLTTASETKITAGASPIVTSTTAQSTTTGTLYTYANESTTTASTVSTASATSQGSTVSTTSSTTASSTATSSATLPALTTQSNSNSAVLPNVTTNESLNSNRGIVATRRLPLNIRSGPGRNYMIVTVLPKGTYVTVLDTSNPDWYMVKTMSNVVGYAYSGYIRIM